MSPEKRLDAATAFWNEEKELEGLHSQHLEAIVAIAGHLKFRPKSVQALPVDRRARQLAHLPAVPEAVITRALIAHHLAAQRPLMAAFLDALGIAHEDGLIKDENVTPPDPAKLASAAATVAAGFPKEDVVLYLNTLVTQDPDTWGGLEAVPPLKV